MYSGKRALDVLALICTASQIIVPHHIYLESKMPFFYFENKAKYYLPSTIPNSFYINTYNGIIAVDQEENLYQF